MNRRLTDRIGALEGTRTPGLQVRNLTLYPTELRARILRTTREPLYYTGTSRLSSSSRRRYLALASEWPAVPFALEED